MTALIEKYSAMADNKNQKQILETMMRSDVLLHQNAMSKHSITQLKIYKENELEADVNTQASKTGLTEMIGGLA